MCHVGNTEPFTEFRENERAVSGVRCKVCGYNSKFNEFANQTSYKEYLAKEEAKRKAKESAKSTIASPPPKAPTTK